MLCMATHSKTSLLCRGLSPYWSKNIFSVCEKDLQSALPLLGVIRSSIRGVKRESGHFAAPGCNAGVCPAKAEDLQKGRGL